MSIGARRKTLPVCEGREGEANLPQEKQGGFVC